MTQDKPSLIDEHELRDALQPLRPDRDAFESQVRRRLEARQQAIVQPHTNAIQVQANEESPWLRVAASVIPLPMVGEVARTSTTLPLGKVSLGFKLLGYLAVPATSLLLALGATLFGMIRIRKAQLNARSQAADPTALHSAVASWWKRFGWLNPALAGLALILMLSGYSLPVYIAFLASGVAMVSLVTRLGQAGMLDRQTVVQSLMPGLAILAQTIQVFAMMDSGVHLLDPALIQAVLFCGVFLLSCLLRFSAGGQRLPFWFISLLCIAMIGFFSQSLWNPVTQDKMKDYVQSFDEARFNSASWMHWEVPASWLQETGVPLDLAKPQQLMQSEMEGKQNPFILAIAFNTHLIQPKDLVQLRDVDPRKSRLLDEHLRDRPISSIQQESFAIQALVASQQLSDADRDLLESRLMITFHEVENQDFYNQLVDSQVITKLLVTIGRPCRDPLVRNSIQKMLADLQCVHFKLGNQQGGFSASQKLDFSDLLTTAAAVELMQTYGVPPTVDIMSLRSYLRSTSLSVGWMQDHVRTAIRQRLESIPQIPKLSGWDYLQHEQNLGMAVLVVLLALFAALGCRDRPVQLDANSARRGDENATR